MKKIILVLSAVITFAGLTSAAQFNWSCANLSDTFDGGTGYLVNIVSGSVTTATIAEYISNNGLTPPLAPNGTYNSLSSATIGSLDEFGYGALEVSQIVGGGAYNVFVIVLSADGKSFAISNGTETYTLTDAQVENPLFGGAGSSDWTTGTVGVPEPTVLALLALGVAGLALKRRVA